MVLGFGLLSFGNYGLFMASRFQGCWCPFVTSISLPVFALVDSTTIPLLPWQIAIYGAHATERMVPCKLGGELILH
jgi:hypothetical protein